MSAINENSPAARRRIDQRWQLRPCDYAEVPELFGTPTPVRFRVPAGGSRSEMERAQMLHRLFGAVRQPQRRVSGAKIARRHGFSRSTWSACALGKRWPAGVVVVAALLAVEQ